MPSQSCKAGCPPCTVKKASVPNKANIFSCSLSTSQLKTPDENPPKIVFTVIEQNQRIVRCLQQIRLFHGSIFHASVKIHITLTGFPRSSFIFRRPYIQRPSESLIFRHRDETEWGREFCLNHRHRNQSAVPFRSISICATGRNVRPKLYPGRRGGFRRAGGIRPRPR